MNGKPETMRDCLEVMENSVHEEMRWKALSLFLGEVAESQGVDLDRAIFSEAKEPQRPDGKARGISWWGGRKEDRPENLMTEAEKRSGKWFGFILAVCFGAVVCQAGETVLKDEHGKRIGTAVTGKPDVLGKTETVIRDEKGKVTGKAITGKPDLFGKTETIIKNEKGQVVGKAESKKPDMFGKVETVIRDEHGKVTGKTETSKPDVLGKTVTRKK